MTAVQLRLLPIGAAVLAMSSAFGADATCKMLAEANLKIYSMPTHIYSTEVANYTNGKTRNSELIYVNNSMYVQIAGKWTLAKDTPKRMAEAHKDIQAEHPNAVCKAVRDEPVNGEAASLYSMHETVESAQVNSQIWISKSRGVPLKVESETDLGGQSGKVHRSMRYEYTNVQAPPGVH